MVELVAQHPVTLSNTSVLLQETGHSPKLRFRIANVARRQIDSSVHIVLIRRIERRDGATLVEVDGEVFALSRCGTVRRPRACLTLRTDLSLDAPELDPYQFGGQTYGGSTGFAQPPP